ncbi:MAG TPA: cytochrome-c oxidase, cbb3-type subunit I [Candidatus Azosocius sp. HAIN]
MKYEEDVNTYNYDIVKKFVVMTIFWGFLGMFFGLVIALELIFPDVNCDIPWLAFGRLRPVHTNLVVFAFACSALMATSYYVVQKTSKIILQLNRLAYFTFWGWQVVILMILFTLPLGYTSAKEYAEPEWIISILLGIVFICYAIVYFYTIYKRKISHIYVSNWFYGAFILAVLLLHVVNNLVIPVSLFKSYSIYSGAVDAMVQWWYGHNAVGFLLTAGFLGMMYYFIPIQAQRPIYSYRLSIVHFWSLIGIYMWAGSHHLHYSALPDWVQSLGMVFSIILLAPSWGGMINGIMTLSGCWDKVKKDPILKFFVLSLTFYGGATFEGSLMAIKTVNSLSHNTDWTIAHVHSGALGWVSMMTIGSFYVLIPRIFNCKMYSISLINIHFWCSTIGTLIYIISMWISGINQGMMSKAIDEYGNIKFAFIDIVIASHPFYIIRFFGGMIFFIGMILMLFNVFLTFKYSKNNNL